MLHVDVAFPGGHIYLIHQRANGLIHQATSHNVITKSIKDFIPYKSPCKLRPVPPRTRLLPPPHGINNHPSGVRQTEPDCLVWNRGQYEGGSREVTGEGAKSCFLPTYEKKVLTLPTFQAARLALTPYG